MIRAALPCALAALWGCVPGATIDPLEFACDAGTDCNDGYRCWRGVCTQDAGFGLGSACSADDDCENRTCSGGVCCSRRCDGACESCTSSGPGQCDLRPLGDPGVPSCAPYRCDGAGTACPGGCAAPGDCGSGTYCDAGRCTPLLALGNACGSGGSCDSGICVDGRCCNTACPNPCDACDVPGKLGTCAFAPLGRVPSPGCGLYACNGASVLCPSSCTSDAGCVPPNSCSFSQQTCQPKLDALTDAFTGTGLDAGTWTSYQDPGTRLVVNNRLELTVNAGTGAPYTGIYTVRTYDATSSRISAQLVQAGNQSLTSLETYFQLLAPDNMNRFGVDITENQLITSEQFNMNYGEPSPRVSFNPSTHKFFRLRLNGTTAMIEASADGGSYSLIGSTTVKPWMQSTYVELGSGRWTVEDAGSLAIWDTVKP